MSERFNFFAKAYSPERSYIKKSESFECPEITSSGDESSASQRSAVHQSKTGPPRPPREMLLLFVFTGSSDTSELDGPELYLTRR